MDLEESRSKVTNENQKKPYISSEGTKKEQRKNKQISTCKIYYMTSLRPKIREKGSRQQQRQTKNQMNRQLNGPDVDT